MAPKETPPEARVEQPALVIRRTPVPTPEPSPAIAIIDESPLITAARELWDQMRVWSGKPQPGQIRRAKNIIGNAKAVDNGNRFVVLAELTLASKTDNTPLLHKTIRKALSRLNDDPEVMLLVARVGVRDAEARSKVKYKEEALFRGLDRVLKALQNRESTVNSSGRSISDETRGILRILDELGETVGWRRARNRLVPHQLMEDRAQLRHCMSENRYNDAAPLIAKLGKAGFEDKHLLIFMFRIAEAQRNGEAIAAIMNELVPHLNEGQIQNFTRRANRVGRRPEPHLGRGFQTPRGTSRTTKRGKAGNWHRNNR